MATWNTDLPDTAVVGEETHVEDHNAIVAAIAEARTVLDTVEAAVTGKAESGHKHAAADITSGTLAAARIPALDIAKVTGLQAALDAKQASGSYATTAQVNAKASQADLTALAARVDALESAATPEA